MNAQQAESLYEAERQQVKQLIGDAWDNKGGFCAWGWLARQGLAAFLDTRIGKCPLCDATKQTYWAGRPILEESDLIVHFNNDHKMTFAEIARKLGPDAA